MAISTTVPASVRTISHDLDYISARLSILAELTPTLENSIIATYVESKTNGTVGRAAFCNRNTVPASTGSTAVTRALICNQIDRENAAGFGFFDVENSHPDPFVNQRTWQVINTTTWDASDTLTIKNIASYGQARESYNFNITGDNTAYPFVEVFAGPNIPQGNQWTFTEELQFQGSALSDRLIWQAGGYLERSKPLSGQEQFTAVFADCSDIFTFKCDPLRLPVGGGNFVTVGSANIARNVYSYRNDALYAQATYDLTDRLALTGGFRYTWDYEDVNADNIRVTPSPTGPLSFSCTRGQTPANPDSRLALGGFCTRRFVQRSNAPTWLINLDYKPTEDLLVYAKYARGYRGGGINESNIGSETWEPEKLDTYEVGFKGTFRGTVSGRFNIAGFWNEFSNQQATVFIPQCVRSVNAGCTAPASVGINGIQNVGQSRIRGVEADASITFFQSLRLDLAYAYLDTEVTGTSTPTCDSTAYDCAQATFLTDLGSPLPYAPENKFTITGTYTLPLDESLGVLSISATYAHTDSQFVSPANTLAFERGAIPFDSGTIPGTDLLNLNANWKSVAGSPIDLGLFATNVTDKKYFNAGGTSLASTGGDFLYLAQPRFYGVRVKYNFGQ